MINSKSPPKLKLLVNTWININLFLPYSETATITEGKNPLNEGESSLTTKDTVEKKENLRY